MSEVRSIEVDVSINSGVDANIDIYDGHIEADIEIGRAVPQYYERPLYDGPTEIEASAENQTIETNGKLLQDNITVEGWQGKAFTIEEIAELSTIGDNVVLTSTVIKAPYAFAGRDYIDFYAPNLETLESASAWQGAKKLKSIRLPKLKDIPVQTQFYFCSDLEYAYIPLLEMMNGGYQFYRTGLVVADFPRLQSITSGYNFNLCSNLSRLNMPLLEDIAGNYDFSACNSLTSVSLPSLKTINGGYTFSQSIALISVDLPDLITITGNGTFYGCSKLSSVNLPKLTATKGDMFRGCLTLKEIYLPSATNIAGNSFRGRDNSSSGVKNGVIKLGQKCTLLSTSFSGCMYSGHIYVPWSQGEVSGAPWGANTRVSIHYDTVYGEDGNVISST